MPPSPKFFATPAALRAWFEKHGATRPDLIVGFHKVGTGKPSITWSEAVDEALCFGWIDGVRHRIDDKAYQNRFTPRRPGSTWSAINIAKVEKLTAEGRMRPAGVAAFERRTANKSGIYSYERSNPPPLSAADTRAFKKNRAAWRYFERLPPGHRRLLLFWISSAKRAETRAARVAKLIAACADGTRLF